jgi:hypothetical protein
LIGFSGVLNWKKWAPVENAVLDLYWYYALIYVLTGALTLVLLLFSDRLIDKIYARKYICV